MKAAKWVRIMICPFSYELAPQNVSSNPGAQIVEETSAVVLVFFWCTLAKETS
jgi:hypothetical protein